MKQEEILGYSQCRFQTVTTTSMHYDYYSNCSDCRNCQHVEGKVDGFLGLYTSAFNL